MDNNINNMISISMPKGCRYMSDYENLLNGELPLDGKFILNKTVTGWGVVHPCFSIRTFLW